MKKWSKLVLATMLSVGTLLVSGCIKNIEPEGIADLRGAKAELLRAQTALQAAQAAKVEADAALVLAQAKVQEAIAKQEEAKVAYEEAKALKAQYEAEYQKLVNEAYAQEQADEHAKRVQELEEKIAKHEQEMAAAEMEAALAAEQFKIAMLQVTQALAEAQLQYDQALLDIEVAKATLTDKQAEFITERFNAVLELKEALRMITEEFEEAADALAEATAELDEPRAQRVAIKRAERAVAVAQATFEAAQEAEAEAKALLELDPMVTDWDAQREAINEELDALRRERYAKYVEATDRAEVWRDSIRILNGLASEYEAFTGYVFNDETGYFSKLSDIVAESIEVPEVYVPAPVVNGMPAFDDLAISGMYYYYGEEKDVLELFDKAISNSNLVQNIDVPSMGRTIEQYEEMVERYENDEGYISVLQVHTDMVKAIESADYLSFFNEYLYDEDYDFETVVADYNSAVEAFETAWNTYETAVANATVDEKKMEQIEADALAAKSDANLAKVLAYQDAENNFKKAEVAYVTAKYAHDVAYAKYQAEVTSVMTSLNEADEDNIFADVASLEDIELWLTSYPGDDLASDYEKELKPKYDAAKTKVETLDKAYNDGDDKTLTDPYSAWEKALDDMDAAKAEFEYPTGSAYSDADAAYDAKIAEIDMKFGADVAALKATTPSLNDGYKSYLSTNISDTELKLKDALAALVDGVEYVWRVAENMLSVEYDGEIPTTFSNVPDYLIDEDGTFAEVDLTSLIDEEYFAYNLGSFAEDYLFGFENPTTYVSVENFDGYPTVLPTYEKYVEWFETCQEAGVYVEHAVGMLGELYELKYAIETLSAIYTEFDSQVFDDFVKAVEAAKAEFVAFAAEEAARIDDLKTKVEANYPRLLAEVEAVKEETDAFDAKVETLEHTLGNLDDIISDYTDGYTELDDFVEYLETAYEDAVQATLDAEQDVIDAEDDLQDLKDGLVTAVEVAQKHYDAVKEAFDLCQTFLEAAVEDLEEAIALVYGDEELPEDPGTEDPDAGEEGGDTEGGEDETPAA